MKFKRGRTNSGNLQCGGFDENAPGDANSLAGDALGGKAGDECSKRNDRRFRDVVGAGESAARSPPVPVHRCHGIVLESSALVCGV